MRARRSQETRPTLEGTGQAHYPEIEFEDGSIYREESKDMAGTIREGGGLRWQDAARLDFSAAGL